MSNAGFKVEIYSGDFASEARGRRIPLKILLAPKFVIDLHLALDHGASQCTLSMIEYAQTGKNSFRAFQSFSRHQALTGMSQEAVKENIILDVQQKLDEYLHSPEAKALLAKTSHKTGPPNHKGESTGSYQFPWIDPNATKLAVQFGATVGTPATGNLYLGVVNIGGLPIGASISGMYWT